MTIAEIKAAVDAGQTVNHHNSAYRVIKDRIGQYLIECTLNGACWGLTNQDGTQLNGKESEFFIQQG